ncbi:hypothetical protein CEUSTIGMA_g3224.t1 [Chlamydomonas eustigma]|uniref:EGF-like domain-containing protein n=1 Tax=Chlamydomonas eustigma TaxID=1157962 RepID=A0A250WY81_9CHLO|nr:hypothetical protein CEUSTIGMA_g3224.t1 [Chlamydomonas eustigma]|eukprot:GAX75781.1 hypothetical protein CEUSTIGMA_g3224.t1 [Chlamydomonas eustigma]
MLDLHQLALLLLALKLGFSAQLVVANDVPSVQVLSEMRKMLEDWSKLPPGKEGHCQVTRGDWCGPYIEQVPVPSRPAPRGDVSCPNDCGGVGNCDYDTGACYCPAGYGGGDCSEERKRPCWRMGPDKRDLDWIKYPEWSHSRCAGICDEDIAMCYCPPETKYGHVLPPEGSPLGSSPMKIGRPLYWCQPSSDKNNNSIKWGTVPYPDLFGEHGWCNADVSSFRCPCRLDGLVGDLCNIRTEMFCANQCT